MRIILASQSPRRRQLIQLLGLEIEAISADVDESLATDPDPAQNAIDTALLKVQVFADLPDAIIIGSDTNVAIDAGILGKPTDSADARAMLTQLRGRIHQVHTGIVALRTHDGALATTVSSSDVYMRDYSDDEISAYIATGDPFDKAGGYAVQHPDFMPVAKIDGCFAGVMGLSVCQLVGVLRDVGVSIDLPINVPCQTTHCFRQQEYDPHFS
jgi:septum formation protein